MPTGTQVASLFGVLTLDDGQFQSGLEKADSGLKTTADKLKTFGAGMQKTGLMTMAAASPFLALGANAVNSAGQSQLALAQLNAVIASTGGQAGVTADHALNLASNLQNVTRFSDETVLSGENMLLTFTNIGANGGVFDQATQTSLDMATALGGDVTQSAMMLGKALNDPVQGVTALRRVGVQLTDAQEAQIEAFVKSGDVMGAQKVILQELQKEFGGSAVAAGQTFPGQLDIMKNKIDDANEHIGNALLPSLSKITEKLDPIITGVADWAAKNPDLILGIIGVAVGAAVLGGVFSVLGTVIAVGGTLLTGVAALIGFLTGPVGLVVLLGGLIAAAVVGYPGGLPKLLKDAGDSLGNLVKIIDWQLNKWISDLSTDFHNLAVSLGLATDASGSWAASRGNLYSGGGQTAGGGSGGGSVGFNALGGDIAAGETSWVGEKGPELFTPSVSGHITSNEDSMRMMGGFHIGTLTINANSYVEGYNAMDGALARARAQGATG